MTSESMVRNHVPPGYSAASNRYPMSESFPPNDVLIGNKRCTDWLIVAACESGALLHLLQPRNQLLSQVFLALRPQHPPGRIAVALHPMGELDQRRHIRFYPQRIFRVQLHAFMQKRKVQSEVDQNMSALGESPSSNSSPCAVKTTFSGRSTHSLLSASSIHKSQYASRLTAKSACAYSRSASAASSLVTPGEKLSSNSEGSAQLTGCTEAYCTPLRLSEKGKCRNTSTNQAASAPHQSPETRG